MRRTTEQVKADEGLTAAIAEVARAYDVLADGELMMEYVVVIGTLDEDEHGVILLHRDGGSPGWRAVGLLEMAKSKITND